MTLRINTASRLSMQTLTGCELSILSAVRRWFSYKRNASLSGWLHDCERPFASCIIWLCVKKRLAKTLANRGAESAPQTCIALSMMKGARDHARASKSPCPCEETAAMLTGIVMSYRSGCVFG